MIYKNNVIQLSPEWWQLKVGKISGTRFGQLISTRDNSLLFEVANEKLNGFVSHDDFVSEDMAFGTENEPVAIDKYEDISGIIFQRGGVLISEFNKLHIASPDGINTDLGIIVEIKCTMNGAKQLARFKNGIESDKWGQIVSYFAVSDDVKAVHFISYCPYRPEKEIVSIIVTRETVVKEKTSRTPETTVGDLVKLGRENLTIFEKELNDLISEFILIN